MFFRNFYGIFNNTYDVKGFVAVMNQSLALYVKVMNTAAYIGNEMLPTGVNPFAPLPVQTYTLQVSVDS